MERYNPTKIEEKWQKIWETEQAFRAEESGAEKMYLAEMFPYPSGAGLHVGHVRNFSIVDVLARFYAQNGKNVLRPFGYDTFGLPAENYAIKTGISPAEATKTNINNFRKQAKRLGFYIDWNREINTSDPEYYRWTQWCFLQLFKKGLAYQKESYQWWCPNDQTVLANEQVENGHCWRCGSEVEKKKMKQWFFKITAYADELLDEIDQLDWPEKIKTMQKNWIGRSEGAKVKFKIKHLPDTIDIFTTRLDTICGATFLVLAPEHPKIPDLITNKTAEEVKNYCAAAIKKSEIERQENKEKTGVFTGSFAINPATKEEIPIWVSDYVLINYGDGAVMAVPGHDERDFAFASKYQLEIRTVVKPTESNNQLGVQNEVIPQCFKDRGIIINSGKYDNLTSKEAEHQILSDLGENVASRQVTYRMRDWLISRQRYWGCPIPIAYDKNGEPHAIPEPQLPVVLPEVSDYRPDKSGHSALAKAEDWLKVTIDGEEMTRETDTLDGYACSSWYLWRYASPHSASAAWEQEAVKYWEPLDIYCGADHAVAHLLYVRFWCKFFADQGYLPFREPVKKLLYNGYINAPDGKKMSKSKGNVIDPLDVIDSGYGADTLRTYELFIGPYNEDAAWSTTAIGGVYRFLNRCFNLAINQQNNRLPSGTSTQLIRHKTIKKVTEDITNTNFNTAVAALMEYVNELYKSCASTEDIIILGKLLKPFAPHLASEILEKEESDDKWPEYNEAYLVSDSIQLIVQVNGKVRAKLEISPEDLADHEKLKELALSQENVQKYLNGEPKKIIIPAGGRLINIVT